MDKLTFGRILIDKKHQFFGTISPMACIVAYAWFSEDDGEDAYIWIDCYRGHIRIEVSELLDKEHYDITDILFDPKKDTHKQLNDIEAKYAKK
jgi:hypothetical protein